MSLLWAQRSLDLQPRKSSFCDYIVSRSGPLGRQHANPQLPNLVQQHRISTYCVGRVNQSAEFTFRLPELKISLRGLLNTSNDFVWQPVHTPSVESVDKVVLFLPILFSYMFLADAPATMVKDRH